MRQHPVSQPVPDSAYILSNLPPARQGVVSTATKAGRTSRSKAVSKQAVNPSKKAVSKQAVNPSKKAVSKAVSKSRKR